MPGVTTIGSYDKFTLYRVDAEPSYFSRGSGTIEAHEKPPRAARRRARRWARRHQVPLARDAAHDPPREIRPVPVEGGPRALHRRVRPPRELVIYNDYDLGIADWLAGRLEPPAAGADAQEVGAARRRAT
jgi:hypothetical protein